jgi:type II secretion system protein N
MNYIIRFFRFLKVHFGKITLGLFFTLIFIFILFPFTDLSDYISAQVSTLTNNKVYLQFNQLHINPLSTSVSIEDVLIETDKIEGLNIKNLTATPSIMALIARKPGGQINAEGLYSGNVNVKITPKSSGKDETQKSKLEVNIEKVVLKELRKSLNLSVPFTGLLNLKAQSDIDLAFTEQPDGDLSFQIQKFEMNSTMVNLPDIGGLNLPEIKLSSIQGKSKFQNGKYTIESLKLGAPTDDFSGVVSGDLTMVIQNMNGQMVPLINGYNLSIDLFAKPVFIEKASFFLNFISQFQKVEATGTRYKFKVTSTGPQMPPQMTALQ